MINTDSTQNPVVFDPNWANLPPILMRATLQNVDQTAKTVLAPSASPSVVSTIPHLDRDARSIEEYHITLEAEMNTYVQSEVQPLLRKHSPSLAQRIEKNSLYLGEMRCLVLNPTERSAFLAALTEALAQKLWCTEKLRSLLPMLNTPRNIPFKLSERRPPAMTISLHEIPEQNYPRHPIHETLIERANKKPNLPLPVKGHFSIPKKSRVPGYQFALLDKQLARTNPDGKTWTIVGYRTEKGEWQLYPETPESPQEDYYDYD